MSHTVSELSPTIQLQKLAEHVSLSIHDYVSETKVRTPVLISRPKDRCHWYPKFWGENPGMWEFDWEVGINICLELETLESTSNIFFITPRVVAPRIPDNKCEHIRLLRTLMDSEVVADQDHPRDASYHHVFHRIATMMSPARYHVTEFEDRPIPCVCLGSCVGGKAKTSCGRQDCPVCNVHPQPHPRCAAEIHRGGQSWSMPD